MSAAYFYDALNENKITLFNVYMVCNIKTSNFPFSQYLPSSMHTQCTSCKITNNIHPHEKKIK